MAGGGRHQLPQYCAQLSGELIYSNGTPRGQIARLIRYGILVSVASATLVINPGAIQGQNASEQDARRWIGGTVGLVSYDAGGNCANGEGVAAGLEVRSTGPWIVGAAADLLYARPSACTAVGLTTEHEGERVQVVSETKLKLAPRVSLGIGHTVDLGRVLVEPTLRSGILGGTTSRLSAKDTRSWMLWYGVGFALEFGEFPIAPIIEFGRFQAPVRYYEIDDQGQLVHEFNRSQRLLRISASL